MINVGIDWAETHHDVCVEDVEGYVLAKARVPEGIEGVERIHEMLGDHAEDPAEVVIGIELDRGLLVGALVAAGYEVHAVNPLAVSRYRDRLAPAGAKSDPGDARVLAEAMRTDRPAPPGGRRLDGGRRGQGAREGAPEPRVDPPASGQPAPLGA